MDLSTCLMWKNRRMYLLSSDGMIREGEIAHVAPAFLKGDDIDIVVRLIDGSVTSVRASDQGRTWTFPEAQNKPAA
jgi:hypothetical protein